MSGEIDIYHRENKYLLFKRPDMSNCFRRRNMNETLDRISERRYKGMQRCFLRICTVYWFEERFPNLNYNLRPVFHIDT